MAAEYRPDLKEAVSILFDGAEKRVTQQPNLKTRNIPDLVKRWAGTPLRRWLVGQSVSEESEPLTPPSRLASERQVRLGQEVYGFYEEVARKQRAYSVHEPQQSFTLDLPVDPDQLPIRLEIMDSGRELIRPQVTVSLLRSTLSADDIAVAIINPEGIQKIERKTLFDNRPTETKSIESDPMQDLLALKTVGEFVKQVQSAQIIDEDKDL